MIERIPDLPPNVIGFEAVGEVSADDYRDVLIPAVKTALNESDRVRLLYVLGERFDGVSAGAAWEDFKLGVEHRRGWEEIAVVTDVDWIGHAIRAVGWMIPGEVRVFSNTERAEAETWVTGQSAP